MKPNKIFPLAALLIPLYMIGQVPSIHENGAYAQQTPANTPPTPPVIWREVFENRGSSSIVAFHAIFNCPKGSKIHLYYDPYSHYGNDANVPPGGSIEVLAADPSRCPGGVVAAIFSDGHSEGDPTAVNDMYSRRRGVYTALEEGINQLGAIASQTETPQQVRETLKRRAESLTYDQTIDGNERLGRVAIYDMLRFTLENTQGVIQAPSDRTPNRQPTYAQLARSQNISLEQAQAIVISKKLQEWRADLESKLVPPDGKS